MTTATLPSVTPCLDGSRYCVPCVWAGARHPRRTDDRVYVVRWSERPLDTVSYCHAHAVDNGHISEDVTA